MAVTVLGHIGNAKTTNAKHLAASIKYILNPDKTEELLWTGGNAGTDADEILESFLATKRAFGKMDGRQGYHYVISFAPGETTEDVAYRVIRDFCEKYLGDRYDYCFAIHNDKQHMHGHVIFNSVGAIDGRKYRYVKGDWEKYIQPITDEICVLYGLEELTYEKEEVRPRASYKQHMDKKEGRLTLVDIVRADIDVAIEDADTMDAYFANMRKMGYSFTRGGRDRGYITYHIPGAEGKKGRIRDRRLLAGYSLADIEQRIRNKNVAPPTAHLIAPIRVQIIRGMTIFQIRAAERVNQASAYHQYDRLLLDQARARKDALKIEMLRDQLDYILRHDLWDLDAAEARKKQLNRKIWELENIQKGIELRRDVWSPEEKELRAQYQAVIGKMIRDRDRLSDAEFESLQETVAQLEKKHGEVVLADQPPSPDREQLQELKRERTLVNRIIREYDATMSVDEKIPYCEKSIVPRKEAQISPQVTT